MDHPRTLTPADVSRAAALLREGTLVAFPTETVYGLGANALNDQAVAEIFALKGRPQFNPLIIHVADIAAAEKIVSFNALARTLAASFWPGPFTLVLPRAQGCNVSLLAGAGLSTLAVRVPAHPLAHALLLEAGVPVAAPSANRSGRISPTRAQHVRQELGDELWILDGGACDVGLESTVVDATGEAPVILRPGAVTAEMIAQACGIAPQLQTHSDAPHSPGMLASHYAPQIPVRLEATNVKPGEVLLAFGPVVPPGTARVLNLSPEGNLKEAAANLFAYLRALDTPGSRAIAVMPIPDKGLGVAINDRLKRAAAK